MIYKALSLWQPWAHAVIHLGKDVENRTWPTHHRGPLLIHASQRRLSPREMREFLAWWPDDVAAPQFKEMQYGGIVGVVDVVDCVRGYPSMWSAAGQFQWVLANPRPLPFRAVRGRQGLFGVELDLDQTETPVQGEQMELFK